MTSHLRVRPSDWIHYSCIKCRRNNATTRLTRIESEILFWYFVFYRFDCNFRHLKLILICLSPQRGTRKKKSLSRKLDEHELLNMTMWSIWKRNHLLSTNYNVISVQGKICSEVFPLGTASIENMPLRNCIQTEHESQRCFVHYSLCHHCSFNDNEKKKYKLNVKFLCKACSTSYVLQEMRK